jgi:hypothetical protein
MGRAVELQPESSTHSTDELVKEVFQEMQSKNGLSSGTNKTQEFAERLSEQSRRGETNPLSFIMKLLVMYDDCLVSKCEYHEAQELANSNPVSSFVC